MNSLEQILALIVYIQGQCKPQGESSEGQGAKENAFNVEVWIYRQRKSL